jgi:hypothetical protein
LTPKPDDKKHVIRDEKQPKRCGILTPERVVSLSGDWYPPFEGPNRAMTSWTEAKLFLKNLLGTK